jgi:hypothetical protein
MLMLGEVMRRFQVIIAVLLLVAPPARLSAEELLKIDNGTVQVGIDRDRGAAVTWLSENTAQFRMPE